MAENNLEADFDFANDKSAGHTIGRSTVAELKRLLNLEEYIPKNMTADQSFDLVNELEMNNIQKE